jgi:alkylhydroperoxidase family enzyme
MHLFRRFTSRYTADTELYRALFAFSHTRTNAVQIRTMRLPYAPSTPPADASADTVDTYARIAERRNPRPLIPLDLSLLHSPPVADGWNSFIGAIRSRTLVDSGVMELAVCRVAVLNNAIYEWNAHAPLALKGGIKPEQLHAARTLPSTAMGDVTELEKSALTPQQRAVLRYTDQMTQTITVEDAVFAELKIVGYDDREIVELTTGIAGYNCVSRFLVALDVGENNARQMKSVDELVAALQ